MTAHKSRETQRLGNWSIIEPEAINVTRSQFDLTQPALIIARRTPLIASGWTESQLRRRVLRRRHETYRILLAVPS
jgi:hypothetical protein